jgi:hypothetical protein
MGVAIASLALASTAGAVAKPATKADPAPKPPHHYVANVQPVGQTASTAPTGPSGRAELNDDKKNDRLTIHMRGLQPNATYSWHLRRQIVCIAAPCTPPEEPGWIYEPLTANNAGNAEAHGASYTFSADPAGTYLVDVQDASGAVVAQGVFTSNPSESKPPKAPRPPKAKGPKH